MATFSADRFFERAMVGTSAFVLLGAAAVLDDRVRGQANGFFAGTALNDLWSARRYVEEAVRQAANTVGYQSSENATLVFFVVAAAVLFLLVLRT